MAAVASDVPPGLTERVTALEGEVAALRAELVSLRDQLGGT